MCIVYQNIYNKYDLYKIAIKIIYITKMKDYLSLAQVLEL